MTDTFLSYLVCYKLFLNIFSEIIYNILYPAYQSCRSIAASVNKRNHLITMPHKEFPVKIFNTLLALTLLTAHAIPAESRSVTFYSDGTVVEMEATAAKGFIEIPLPASMIEGSLRIRPVGGATLQRVDIVTARTDTAKGEKGVDALLEQRSRLGDRLQALATREEIFKSAAKSQSGKAPRKSKNNPDPMQTIRQGTEFAIAQLEAVYTARRRTEEEIRRIDNRIAAVKDGVRGPETVARIHVSPARGTVTARYALAGGGWAPRYDMFLDGGNSAQLCLSGQLSGAYPGYQLRVSPAALAEWDSARVFPVNSGPAARMASFHLPVSEVRFGSGVRGSFSCVLKNTEKLYLPGGSASLYRSGEYVGGFRFEGISSGRSRVVSAGM
jgi:hypothetical protein